MFELVDTNLIRTGSEVYELERKPQALPQTLPQENSFAGNPSVPLMSVQTEFRKLLPCSTSTVKRPRSVNGSNGRVSLG